MKTFLNYLGPLIMLIAAVLLIVLYVTGAGNNTYYGAILVAMLAAIGIQIISAYIARN